MALGRRPRTRKARSELISPISPAYPAASRTPCCSGTLRQPQQCYYQEHFNEGTGCFPIAWAEHGQLGRLPSAKHGCPPGLGPLPVRLHRLTNVITTRQVFVVRFCFSALQLSVLPMTTSQLSGLAARVSKACTACSGLRPAYKTCSTCSVMGISTPTRAATRLTSRAAPTPSMT